MDKIELMSFLGDIANGVIANILFTLFLIYAFQHFRYWIKIKRHFHNASFAVSWKLFPNDIVITVKCKVRGHRILFTGVKNDKNDPFEGEFIVNPINLKYGEGHHSHLNSEGYAFAKVIIKDNKTLLVDAPYTKVVEEENEKKKKYKKGSMVYQSYIWRKVDNPLKT